MERRKFMLTTTAALLLSALPHHLVRYRAVLAGEPEDLWRVLEDGPEPLPEITAAVDVLVPADPEIPGDFKGSDYGGDRVLAAMVEDLGQAAIKSQLDKFSQAVNGVPFIDGDDPQRLEAIREWVRNRDELDALSKDLLSGLISFAVLGTYENNPPDQREALYMSMGWYDPKDPAGTFRVPNSGYVDSHLFPIPLDVEDDR